MLHRLIVIAFLFSARPAGALTVWSVAPSDWENANTWSNHQVPSTPDTIIVRHYVTFNQNLTIHAPTVFIIDSAGTICGDYRFDISCGAKWFNYGRAWVNSAQMMDAWNYNEFYATNSITISACSLPGYNTGYHNVPPNGHTAVWPPVVCRTQATGWDGRVDGIAGFEKSGIRIFPNPVKEELLHIHAPGDIYTRLTDIFGRELFSTHAFQLMAIDLSSYPQGVYLMQVTQDGSTYSKKILKIN